MENRSSGEDVDDVAKDSSGDGIQEQDFAEELASELPSMAPSSSAPPGSSPYASLQGPSASKVDDRDVAHGAMVSDIKKLEHALPNEAMHLPGFVGMVDSMERPPLVFASNHDIAPGAFPIRSARNTATSATFRPPLTSYDSPGELSNDESNREDRVPSSAGIYAGAHDRSHMAAGSGLYTVEAQRVPDGNEDGTVIVAEAQYLNLKWYQRRWIVVGLACGLFVTVVVIVVLVVRQPAGAPSSSGAPTTPDPSPAPTVVTPVAIACNFLSIPNVTRCQSTFGYDDSTTGSTIPSEIGLLTQLTGLYFYDNSLTSTIPSEIGLLTGLTSLYFHNNQLTSTIPSEIGLLTQLTYLDFNSNELTGTVPTSLCSLPSLVPYIVIDCGEVTCAPGCCFCV